MLDEHSLTICTVSYGHASYLALNWKLCETINRAFGDRISWLIAENAPESADSRIGIDDPHFRVRPGSKETSRGASYHHADAMNALLQDARSRFVLVLDPDFYLLLPEWVSAVQAHMDQRGLAFFGVPWHPRYTNNYRYFPAVHCMFIDQSRAPLRELDFRPLLEEGEDASAIRYGNAGSLLDRCVRGAGMGHRVRRSWDTGTRIYERFAHDRHIKTECVTPVFRSPWDELNPRKLVQLKSRMIEAVLPDRLCYVPKRPQAYTRKGFRERGWIAAELPPRWEEHVWHDQPFGIHMRRSFSAANRDPQKEFELCREQVSAYMVRWQRSRGDNRPAP